ncbi:MAG: hypothetical protein ACODAJ_08750, partial [Planctomycetota bacterium]
MRTQLLRSAGLAVLLMLCVGCTSPRLPWAAAGSAVGERAVLLVPVPQAPSWHDFAFLAAVPAATRANAGKPAVIALEATEEIPREIADYLEPYKPRTVYTVGFEAAHDAPKGAQWRALDAASADGAAHALAGTFWQACPTVVVCRDDDYSAGLVASALAARLRSPLLFSTDRGMSGGASAALRRLGPSHGIVVGAAPEALAALKKQGLAVTALADAKSVLAWMHKQKLGAAYVAATNPRDRSATVTRKLSLTAPLLAAAREGAVVPLDYETLWKA